MADRKLMFGCFFLTLYLNVVGKYLNLWTKTRRIDNVLLKHFWKNTGFCPAYEKELRTSFLLSDDVKLNLDFIGALPNQAIEMIRIHWILDLVTVSDPDSEKPTFHLDNLDRLIERLHRNGLYPDFELMGNPSNFFRDFKTQSHHWVSMIEHIVKHYSDLYGADYLTRWRFELMNEPDLKQYNPFNFTLEKYIDYFRASEKALASMSGPAGLFRDNKKAHPLCWGFLDFCNLYPCNLNMITFHRKGGEVGSQVVAEGLNLINELISKYPNLKGVPFGNSEADIMVGWAHPKEWRADVRYAALVVQVIIGHIKEMHIERNIPFEMLSNDNAFLSFSPNYFTQRTLLARFQMNNTTPRHVQFFRKPIYSVMGMLSLLGDNLIDVFYRPGKQGFSSLMTSYKYQDTYLAVVTDDEMKNERYTATNESRLNVNVKMALRNLTLSGMCAGYIMDNDRSNPNQVWREAGSPDFPDPELRRRMRQAEGFQELFLRKVKPHQTHIKFFLKSVSVPSIILLNTCYEGTDEPGRVTDLRYENVTHNEILLFWKDTFVKSRCILTYVVEVKKARDVLFRRINKSNSIFLSYHHAEMDINGSVSGEYRVAAVDYWNRFGGFSDVLTVAG